MYQKLTEYFKDRSVLILGFGKEGQSTYNFIRRFYPDKPLAIADKRELKIDDPNVTLITGDSYLDHINDFDMVMQSPGISLRSVKICKKTEITGQMDLFLRFAECTKIGITGTKGKTTTTTLIYNIVKASGRKCALIGNIGVPVFESLDDCEGLTAVIEMSCHQLEFAKASPQIAVMTNIYPEHLDHYNGFEGYANAKLNIVKNQTKNDSFVYNSDQEELKALINFDDIESKLLPVSRFEEDTNDFYKHLTTLNENLKGYHTHQDIFFAVNVARCLGISDEAIEEGIRSFTPIAHRMEKVGTWKDVTFYNDSIATIPHAVMCAISALEKVDSLIFGGLDRGIDYTDFVKDLNECNVSNLIGLPETGEKIINELKKIGCTKNLVIVNTMDEAVEAAYKYTEKGKICLFSPAASSYNRYKNFEEKGNHFKILAKEFGEKRGNN